MPARPELPQERRDAITAAAELVFGATSWTYGATLDELNSAAIAALR